MQQRIASASIKGAFKSSVDGKPLVAKILRVDANKGLAADEAEFGLIAEEISPFLEAHDIRYPLSHIAKRVFATIREEVDVLAEIANSKLIGKIALQLRFRNVQFALQKLQNTSVTQAAFSKILQEGVSLNDFSKTAHQPIVERAKQGMHALFTSFVHQHRRVHADLHDQNVFFAVGPDGQILGTILDSALIANLDHDDYRLITALTVIGLPPHGIAMNYVELFKSQLTQEVFTAEHALLKTAGEEIAHASIWQRPILFAEALDRIAPGSVNMELSKTLLACSKDPSLLKLDSRLIFTYIKYLGLPWIRAFFKSKQQV